MKPILFVLGPSGAGKSVVSKAFHRSYSFLHVDIDQDRDSKHGFELNHFPAQWDRDISLIDFTQLGREIQRRITQQAHAGAVISVPTTHVFSSIQLVMAYRAGLSTVVLWGTEQQCIQARRVRSKKNRKRFNEKDVERYKEKNRRTFETYSRSEYDRYRIEVFCPYNGTHWPLEHNLSVIMQQTGWSLRSSR
jgi:adenylate kinase family enzyme